MPAAKLFGEPSRLFQMVSTANVWIYFRYAKEKEEKKYNIVNLLCKNLHITKLLCIFVVFNKNKGNGEKR